MRHLQLLINKPKQHSTTSHLAKAFGVEEDAKLYIDAADDPEATLISVFVVVTFTVPSLLLSEEGTGDPDETLREPSVWLVCMYVP